MGTAKWFATSADAESRVRRGNTGPVLLRTVDLADRYLPYRWPLQPQ